MSEPILRYRAFSLTLTSGEPKRLLQELDLQLKESETVALIGRSGSGKTMMLRSAMSLYEDLGKYDTSGSIDYRDGENWIRIVPSLHGTRARARKESLAFIPQQSQQVLNPGLRIYRQMRNAALSAQNPVSEDQFENILKDVGFKDAESALKKYPHQFSGGQIQRILIALALVRNAKILLVDEPTSNLDEALKKDILELLDSIKQKYKLSMLLVSHELELTAGFCDRIVVIQEGRILEIADSIDELRMKSSVYIQNLLQGSGQIRRNAQEPEDSPVLEVVNLSKSFRSSRWDEGNSGNHLVFKDINISLLDGEILSIVGESGSGKTSLAKVIAGLMPADHGKIIYKSMSLDEMKPEEFSVFRKSVQMIFQDALASLPPNLTVSEILSEVCRFHNKKFDREYLIAYVRRFGLEDDILERRIAQMSGGQRQRLLIARALLTNPKVLICDEIVSSLDPELKQEIINLMLELHDEYRFAIIFITHELSLARMISDRLIQLDS